MSRDKGEDRRGRGESVSRGSGSARGRGRGRGGGRPKGSRNKKAIAREAVEERWVKAVRRRIGHSDKRRARARSGT